MPTKIVSAASNPAGAEINQADLQSISADFQKNILVSTTDSRKILKNEYVSIPLKSIKALIDMAAQLDNSKDDVFIRIKFGISLPGLKDCISGSTDISNELVTVALIEQAGVEKSNVGDYVLTPGFKSFLGNNLAKGIYVCCPTQTPPPKG